MLVRASSQGKDEIMSEQEIIRSLCPVCQNVEFGHTVSGNDITICPLCRTILELIDGKLVMYSAANHDGFVPDAVILLREILPEDQTLKAIDDTPPSRIIEWD